MLTVSAQKHYLKTATDVRQHILKNLNEYHCVFFFFFFGLLVFNEKKNPRREMTSNTRTASSPLKSLQFRSAAPFQAQRTHRDREWVILGSRTHFRNYCPDSAAASSKVTILSPHFPWYCPCYGSRTNLLIDPVCIIRLCTGAKGSLPGLSI